MFALVTEVFRGNEPDPRDELCYWTYLIVSDPASGNRGRYHLFRIDNCVEKMERLGCELTMAHCRKLIKEREPTYPNGRNLLRRK